MYAKAKNHGFSPFRAISEKRLSKSLKSSIPEKIDSQTTGFLGRLKNGQNQTLFGPDLVHISELEL